MARVRCPTCGTPLRFGSCPRCRGVLARPDLVRARRGAGPIGRALDGLHYALRGAILTLSRPRLLLLAVLPLLIQIALFTAVVFWLVEHRSLFAPDWSGPWPDGLETLRTFLLRAISAAAVLLAAVVALAATLVLSTAINAPFLEWLSEATETIVLGEPDRRPIDLRYVWEVWVRPILQAFALACAQGLLSLTLLLLSLTGVLAPLVLFGGLYLTAVTLLDIVIARKGYRVRDRFALVLADLPLWLGVALPFFWLPFLLPLGVAGATLAYLDTLRRTNPARSGPPEGRPARGGAHKVDC